MPLKATLYVVATPLGNLGDLSSRAVETLNQVSVVACEDTRRTGKLLTLIGTKKRLLSLHSHNEAQRTQQILSLLEDGEEVALVSDAGTPAISDPGERLVRAVVEAGGRVSPVPGPSAVATLISVAGFGGGDHRFVGFAPRERKRRRGLFEEQSRSRYALILFESPQRILALLEVAKEVLGGEWWVCIGRELTKLHEEIIHAPLEEASRRLQDKEKILGEFTLAFAASDPSARDQSTPEKAQAFALRLAREALSARSIKELMANYLDIPSRLAYKIALAAVDQVEAEEEDLS